MSLISTTKAPTPQEALDNALEVAQKRQESPASFAPVDAQTWALISIAGSLRELVKRR